MRRFLLIFFSAFFSLGIQANAENPIDNHKTIILPAEQQQEKLTLENDFKVVANNVFINYLPDFNDYSNEYQSFENFAKVIDNINDYVDQVIVTGGATNHEVYVVPTLAKERAAMAKNFLIERTHALNADKIIIGDKKSGDNSVTLLVKVKKNKA